MSARTGVARTSVRDALDSASIPLRAAGCDTPRLDAEVLLAHVLGVQRGRLLLDPGRGLEPSEARAYQDLVQRRSRWHEPVSQLVGRRGFRFLELEVDGRVLTPRPETEHLVEAALELPAGARVVDVGTGSGAVALALKAERPDLEVTGTDVSADALEVARANAARLRIDVAFTHHDLLARRTGVDAVVSNPPYIADGERATLPQEVVRWEPAVALFGGVDGLDVIRRLVPAAHAAGATFLALEVGQGQAVAVRGLIVDAGFPRVDVHPDLAGIERIVVGRC